MFRQFAVFWMILACMAGAPAGAQSPSQQPLELIRSLSQELLTQVQANRDTIRSDREYGRNLVRSIVLPHVDMPVVSRWVLGKHWRTASEQQRLDFEQVFSEVLVRTYAASLADLAGINIQFMPFHIEPGARKGLVKTEVPRTGGLPVQVNYSLVKREEKWRVYDVSIEGVSLVSNYRTSYSRDIRAIGLDGLIERLRTSSQTKNYLEVEKASVTN